MDRNDNSHRGIDRKSKQISVWFLVSCEFLVNSLSFFIHPQPAQAQVTYQNIQQMGKKVCFFMGGRSTLDRQTLMIMTHIFEQDFADPNPVSFALNRYVFKNCHKDYLAYEQRKRRNNPFAKNPLIVKTGVPLLSGNSTPLLSGNSTPLLNENSTPETAEIYRKQGMKLLTSRNYQAAIVAYDRAISLDFNTASDYYYRGLSLYKVRKIESALTDMERAIELDPNHGEFYLGRGFIIAKIGDRKTALTNYNRAIELNPNLALAYHQRSLLRRELGDIEGAELDRTTAVKLGFKLIDN
jgi:tetratricopeptide (TPR) repeat protein